MDASSNSDLILEGIFWLPKNSSNKISGKITIVDSEAELELKGSLIDPASITFFGKPQQEDIILGQLDGGEFVTLYDCYLIGSRFGRGISSKYAALYCFKNVHFQKIKDIKFKSITIMFNHLDNWLSTSGFKLKHFTSLHKVTIKYNDPKPIKILINSELECEINFYSKSSSITYPLTEFGVEQKSYIKLKPKTEKTIVEVTKLVRLFQNFLTLALGTPCRPLSINGELDPNTVKKENISSRSNFSEIIFHTITSKLTNAEIREGKVLFRYPAIKRQLRTIFKNLLQIEDRIGPVFRLYFATLYNRNMYLEQHFLYLAHSIESYHRLTMKNRELSPSQHQKRISQIMNNIPAKYEEWLKERLNFSNEPTLNTRLLDIIKKYNSVLGNPSPSDIDQFTSKFRQTRNYLTHYGSKGKYVLEGEELALFTRKLEIILEIILSYELGVKRELILSMLKQRIPYYRIDKIIE